MKNFFLSLCVITGLTAYSCTVSADEFEFTMLERQFKNFMTCELTRTDAANPFGGKPFKITMIDLFDMQQESDLQIVTGAVQCFVDQKYHTLYTAVGIKKILGVDQVLYFTLRKTDFSILSTELIKHPYKERCKWTRYFVDID